MLRFWKQPAPQRFDKEKTLLITYVMDKIKIYKDNWIYQNNLVVKS